MVKAFSDFGTWLDYCVFTYLALGFGDGKVEALSYFMIFRLSGSVVAGAISGRLLRAENAIQWMVAADFVRALLLGILLIPQSLNAPLLWIVSGCLSFFGGIFEISLRSKIPEIKGQRSLESINSSFILASAGGMVAGVALSGVFNKLGLWKWAIAIDILSFVVSIAFLKTIGDSKGFLNNQSNQNMSAVTPDLTQNFQWSRIPREIVFLGIGIVALRGIDAFGSSTHNLSLPLIAKSRGGENEALLFGGILATWALGKFYVKLRIKRPASLKSFFWSTLGMSASFIALSYSPHWTLCLAIVFVCGIFDAISEAHGLTLIQQMRDSSATLVTRLFGLWTSLQSAGILAGCFVFGPLINSTNFPKWVLIGHGFAICCCILAYLAKESFSIFSDARSAKEPSKEQE